MQAVQEIIRIEPIAAAAAAVAVLSGAVLLFLICVGLWRRWFAALTAEVLVRRASAHLRANQPAPGTEHRKRLYRLYAAAGAGDPIQWNRFIQELCLLESEHNQRQRTFEVQVLSDAAGREVEAYFERAESSSRREVLRVYRQLFRNVPEVLQAESAPSPDPPKLTISPAPPEAPAHHEETPANTRTPPETQPL